MKKALLKLAVTGVLGLASSQTWAAGSLCALPTTGNSPTSAYINAYNQGRVIPPLAGPATTVLLARMNFGSTADGGPAGNCEVTGLASDLTAPLAGYSLVTSATRTIPPTTGGVGSIGTVMDVIWRKPAATAPVTPTDMCIFGARVTLTNSDHLPGTPGTQYFTMNDIARGGFANSGTVNVGYFKNAVISSRLFRVGRTFTSVQHRAYIYDGGTVAQKQNNATGYLDLPPIAGSATTAINGNTAPAFKGVVAPAAPPNTQQAQVNSNWVDFTHDAQYLNTNAVSAMTYVEAPCNNDSAATINASWVKAGAIRLRQTMQESQPGGLKEIEITGYAPPGAVVP